MLADEFQEWQMDYEENGYWEDEANRRAALLASTIANRHRNPQREPRYTIDDFMPHPTTQPAPVMSRRQTAEEIRAMMGAWLEA